MAAPKNNTNAEKWTIEKATEFFNKAIALSKDKEYDFIGEIAYDLDQDKGTFDYLVDKFPELSILKSRIKNNCEVNCFRNLKKENINVAAGIINLKANHGWSDRISQEINANVSFPILANDPLNATNDDTMQD
jgi:hypothetical protein